VSQILKEFAEKRSLAENYEQELQVFKNFMKKSESEFRNFGVFASTLKDPLAKIRSTIASKMCESFANAIKVNIIQKVGIYLKTRKIESFDERLAYNIWTL
jgi:hypothetical protein